VADNDGRLAQIRESPTSPAGQELLHRVLAEVLADVDAMTSIDVPRLRAVAAMLSDVAQYQPPAERAAAKAGAAMTDRVADFLDELGRIAARGFHVQ
jgi:hypothetical protein